MYNKAVNGETTGAGRRRSTSLLQKNWQVMAFDEYGRSIRINRFNRLLVILVMALLVLLLTTSLLTVLFVKERSGRLALQSSLTQAREKIISLRDENDALLARLAVLTELKADSGGTGQGIQPDQPARSEADVTESHSPSPADEVDR